MGTAVKHPVPDLVKLVSFVMSVRVPGCQKLQMTALTRSGSTGCFIAVPVRQQWASNG